ncbi:aprataxin and PNK-like factor [Genypterus blacodes]|uniref:aprataxin and PNK-like factor n=1 Tax=Genypterus blacodes TaxID=154954 RepID=UPI003F7616FB
MSGYSLSPVDGGEPILLPPGQTVLGRGPLLGISDKRVSRHHGLLENLNGQLRLKPTHLNPCFIQSSLDDDPQPLNKGHWYTLHHGVFFSLLPGKLIYKVKAVGGGDSTPRNSQAFEEDNMSVSSEPDVEPHLPSHPSPSPTKQTEGETPPPIRQDQAQTPAQDEPVSSGVERSQHFMEQTNVPNRTSNQGESALSEEMEDPQRIISPKSRVLPRWMMTAVAAPGRPASTPKAQLEDKAIATPSNSTKQRTTKRVTHTSISSAEEEELSEEEEMLGRKTRMKRRNADTKTLQEPKSQQQSETKKAKVSDDSTMEVANEVYEAETFTREAGYRQAPAQTADASESDDEKQKSSKEGESVGSDGGASASVSVPSKLPHRTACPYGKECYRKNPVHFQECSHPGDSDYKDEDEMDEEGRPECPYGTSCYRKNPLHRKEYKHVKRSARTTRAVPADEEEDDEFEDDDSFIDDSSEDVANDSDYVPPNSEDSSKEDMNLLQTEAKAFMRGKK